MITPPPLGLGRSRWTFYALLVIVAFGSGPASAAWDGQDPDYNSIMLMPTPATLGKGDSYFRNFELFFLNFGHAVSDGVNLSAGTVFPVSRDLLSFSFGGKVRLLDRREQGLGIAVTGSGTITEEETIGFLGGVIGVGDPDRSLNAAVNGAISSEEDDAFFFFLVGGDLRVGAKVKLLVEYGNSTDAIGNDDDDDFNGLINLGVRLFGESMSFSLTGIRPLEETGGDFLLFPLAMFSMHW